MSRTFHQRPLPQSSIPFASAEGRSLFREALADGTLEGFFALAEQFHTQQDPSFCGLGSLVVVLNALAIDPGRLWKGGWRWFSEELLDCCVPLDHIREHGLTLAEVGCLAQCNGAKVVRSSPDRASLDAFRLDVLASMSAPRGPFVIVSYSRQELDQSGLGHLSPVGGYHRAGDLVLVLDVARFKYPPHWVPLERLYNAMKSVDVVTGKPRGWLSLDAAPIKRSRLYALSARVHITPVLAAAQSELAAALELQPPSCVHDAVNAFARAYEKVALLFEARDNVSDHVQPLRSTKLYAHVEAESDLERDILALLFLASEERTWRKLPIADEIQNLKRVEDPELEREVSIVRDQIAALSRMAACSA